MLVAAGKSGAGGNVSVFAGAACAGGEKNEAIFGATGPSTFAGIAKGAGSVLAAGALERKIAVGAVAGVSAATAGAKKAEGLGCGSISGTAGSSAAGASAEAKGSISGLAGG